MTQKKAIQNVLDTFETPRGKFEFICNWLEDINWHTEHKLFYETLSSNLVAWAENWNTQQMQREMYRAREVVVGFTAIYGYGIRNEEWLSEGSGKEFVNELIAMLKI